MTDLTNKVIWITGASSGIGKALAQTAAQHDTKLILSGRRTDALDALADELAVDCLVLPFEVTDFEALEHKVEAAWRFLFLNLNLTKNQLKPSSNQKTMLQQLMRFLEKQLILDLIAWVENLIFHLIHRYSH